MGNPEEKYRFIMLPAQDEKGKPVLSVVAKRTYDIVRGGPCRPSAAQHPLIAGDVFFNNGNPLATSCELESDYIPYKLATDVVLNAKAYAPGNKPIPLLIAELQLGKTSKRIAVFGNRKCVYRTFGNPVFSDPEPFTSMELRYENAYGGTDVKSHNGREYMYPRNPIGKGFVLKRKRGSIEELELPNLEDPENGLTPDYLIVDEMKYWQQFPLPQSFGWYGKSWFPRASFAGVMPADTLLYDQLREAQIGYLPKEHIESFKKLKMQIMDFRFFSGATPGLSLPFLKGDESIRLFHCNPDFPEFVFSLPAEKPHIAINIGEGAQETDVALHTVMILKEKNQVCLTWRGALPYQGPEQFQHFKEFTITVE
jgi:hypothetical protein